MFHAFKNEHLIFTTLTMWFSVLAFLTGCQPLSTPSPEVQVIIAPPVTETPPLECKSSPGVDIDAKPMSSSEIYVKVTGLLPNEHVTFVFHAEQEKGSITREISPLSANENGIIEHTEHAFNPKYNPREWLVQVVHSRGVACADITLP